MLHWCPPHSRVLSAERRLVLSIRTFTLQSQVNASLIHSNCFSRENPCLIHSHLYLAITGKCFTHSLHAHEYTHSSTRTWATKNGTQKPNIKACVSEKRTGNIAKEGFSRTLTGQTFKLNFAIFLGENDLNSEKGGIYESPSRPLCSQFFSR